MTNRKESLDLPALTQEEEEECRAPVLTEGTSSMVGDIAAAVAIRDGDLCFLTDAGGTVPLEGRMDSDSTTMIAAVYPHAGRPRAAADRRVR